MSGCYNFLKVLPNGVLANLTKPSGGKLHYYFSFPIVIFNMSPNLRTNLIILKRTQHDDCLIDTLRKAVMIYRQLNKWAIDKCLFYFTKLSKLSSACYYYYYYSIIYIVRTVVLIFPVIFTTIRPLQALVLSGWLEFRTNPLPHPPAQTAPVPRAMPLPDISDQTLNFLGQVNGPLPQTLLSPGLIYRWA